MPALTVDQKLARDKFDAAARRRIKALMAKGSCYELAADYEDERRK